MKKKIMTTSIVIGMLMIAGFTSIATSTDAENDILEENNSNDLLSSIDTTLNDPDVTLDELLAAEKLIQDKLAEKLNDDIESVEGGELTICRLIENWLPVIENGIFKVAKQLASVFCDTAQTNPKFVGLCDKFTELIVIGNECIGKAWAWYNENCKNSNPEQTIIENTNDVI